MVSALVRAQDEDGDRLSDAEIVSMVFLLLFAGHDTTSGLISTGMLALLEHPDQLELLRSQPDLARSTAVEELLRFCSPVACGAVRRDRKSVVSGRSVSVRVGLGGRSSLKKKKKET